MSVKQLIEKCGAFKIINEGELDRDIDTVYCCDLLSIVMGRAPDGCAWVTVMGNVNAVAVSVLADMACVIIAENAAVDSVAVSKAEAKNVTVLKTELPVFEAAMMIHRLKEESGG
ncbi:hypothetical protein FACS1894120_2290 [Clostridia bacterium]|nr:hypothetical protein FACS1894120_2290 [Clostridia bacterium]